MIDPLTLRRIGFGLLFVILSGVVVFIRLLPLGNMDGGLMPPDLIVCLGFAWVLRRPDFVPVLLFAAVLLLTDLLFLRPPGVWTAVSVIGLEVLRSRVGLLRDQPFLVEWATVAAVLVVMMLAERTLLSVFFVDQAGFGLSVMSFLSNVLAYPLVVAVSVWAFRVRRLLPGELAVEARLA
jgi:rod shape-determining protein MreD